MPLLETDPLLLTVDTLPTEILSRSPKEGNEGGGPTCRCRLLHCIAVLRWRCDRYAQSRVLPISTLALLYTASSLLKQDGYNGASGGSGPKGPFAPLLPFRWAFGGKAAWNRLPGFPADAGKPT